MVVPDNVIRTYILKYNKWYSKDEIYSAIKLKVSLSKFDEIYNNLLIWNSEFKKINDKRNKVKNKKKKSFFSKFLKFIFIIVFICFTSLVSLYYLNILTIESDLSLKFKTEINYKGHTYFSFNIDKSFFNLKKQKNILNKEVKNQTKIFNNGSLKNKYFLKNNFTTNNNLSLNTSEIILKSNLTLLKNQSIEIKTNPIKKTRKKEIENVVVENILPLVYENSNEITKIKVANWNLQIFGVSKASNESLLEFYANTIKNYDIVFIQEIRDKSETSFPKLCLLLSDFECRVSSRAGNSVSKEQYGVIYKKDINILDFKDYNTQENSIKFNRPPIGVTFQKNNQSFTVFNIHTDPDVVSYELTSLSDLVNGEENKDDNYLIIGDLNADCRYYKPSEKLHFKELEWVIDDESDTTVSLTDCAYDRIILSQKINKSYSSYGIFKENITKKISDHYLVWIEFNLINSTKKNETPTQTNQEDVDSENSGTDSSTDTDTSTGNENGDTGNTDTGENENITPTPIIKKSTSGICHDENSSYYKRTKTYTNFTTIQLCLDSGGRLPK